MLVRLCHHEGNSRQSLTVRSVCGTSIHHNYQTDLQHMHSLVYKSSAIFFTL